MTESKRVRIKREQIERAQARLLALAERQPEPVDFSKQEAIAFLLPLLRQCKHHPLHAALEALNGDELDYTLATLKSCKARAMKSAGEDGPEPVVQRAKVGTGDRGGNGSGPAQKPLAPPPVAATPPDVAVPPRPGTGRRSSSAFPITPD